MAWLGFIEYIGLFSGILCVYLATQQNIFSWFFTIVSSIAYIVVFSYNDLHGLAVLQLFYIIISLYGWIFWKNSQKMEIKIQALTHNQILFTLTSIVLLGGLTGFFLSKYTNSNLSYIDGMITIGGIVAQVLLSRKILQNWLLWIVLDAAIIPLYLYKGLYPTALLYGIYLYLAYKGYTEWKTQKSI